MLILGDIHGNWEARGRCSMMRGSRGVTDYACVGDVVGYNGDPVRCLETLQEPLAAPGGAGRRWVRAGNVRSCGWRGGGGFLHWCASRASSFRVGLPAPPRSAGLGVGWRGPVQGRSVFGGGSESDPSPGCPAAGGRFSVRGLASAPVAIVVGAVRPGTGSVVRVGRAVVGKGSCGADPAPARGSRFPEGGAMKVLPLSPAYGSP